MHRSLLAFLVSVLALCHAAPTVFMYGISSEVNDNNEIVEQTLSINIATGKTAVLSNNFVFAIPGMLMETLGDGTFNSKTGTYYYYSDVASGYVFSSNVYTQEVTATYSTAAEEVNSLVWDETNQQLLVNGLYADGYGSLITTISDHDAPEILVNMSQIGIPFFSGDAADGIYYLMFVNETVNTTYIGSFPIEGSGNITLTTAPVSGCNETDIMMMSMHYDSKLEKFVGVAVENGANLTQYYYEVFNGSCNFIELDDTYFTFTTAFDRKTHRLYLSSVAGVNNQDMNYIQTFDTVAHEITDIILLDVSSDTTILDIAVHSK